ncbi:MAG TPA: hypothetical protein PLF26_08640 [Blastocatellia bacterium]|nr:hypothetical protein [Blastocatellia bacterium]
MAKFVTGIVNDRMSAEFTVDRLVQAGFSMEDISVLMSTATRGREFGVIDSTKAPEGAAAGAAIGGVLGAIAAGLVAVGIVAAPGLGLVAAGPLLALLAGAGAGGGAGGLIGGLVGTGLPEHEARLYSDKVEHGGILVGVFAHDDKAKEAEKILEGIGARSVSTR